MKQVKFFYRILFFLGIYGHLTAYQEIPEPPDPANVPQTFLQQERSVVLHCLKYTKIKGDEAILHLGCRDGYLTNEIAQYLPEGRIVGLENVFVEEPQVQSSNISFLQAKFIEQGWENCYDYVICTQFDEWDDNPDKLFYAIRKALKSGGKAIILICTNTALHSINPLYRWLQRPENQEYAESLQFWSNVDSSKFQLLIQKYPNFHSISWTMRRMIACFRDLDQFKEESRNWFRKIALLPLPLQDLPLSQLSSLAEYGMINVQGQEYYHFIYRLEILCCRKVG